MKTPPIDTLTPAQALSPADEQTKGRVAPGDLEDDDFGYMMDFVDGLCPHVRKYHKTIKSDDDMTGRPDRPLYIVFGKLLELVDEFKSDPEFEARWRAHLPVLRESERRITARRKAEKKCARATAKAQELARLAVLARDNKITAEKPADK